MTPRAEVKLCDPSAWVHIGNEKLRRLGLGRQDDGRAAVPDRRPAAGHVDGGARAPAAVRSKASSFDAAAAMQIKGVVDVVETPRGVAVVKRDTWSAIKGRDAQLG